MRDVEIDEWNLERWGKLAWFAAVICLLTAHILRVQRRRLTNRVGYSIKDHERRHHDVDHSEDGWGVTD